MYSKFLVIFFLLVSAIFSNCKVKINRKVNGKEEGKWVAIDTFGNDIYIAKKKYHKGVEVGVFRSFKNNILEQKGIHKNRGKYLTKFYYPNGKVSKKGYAKTVYDEKTIHWFYFGKWFNYNEKGELTRIDLYVNGQLKSSDTIKYKKNISF